MAIAGAAIGRAKTLPLVSGDAELRRQKLIARALFAQGTRTSQYLIDRFLPCLSDPLVDRGLSMVQIGFAMLEFILSGRQPITFRATCTRVDDLAVFETATGRILCLYSETHGPAKAVTAPATWRQLDQVGSLWHE